MSAKILAFAGSARRDSFNKKLVRAAAKFAEQAGAEVTVIDLADYPAPVLDMDFEAENGLPEKMCELKELLKAQDALIVASPEYNGSLTALLKNTLDWCSRKEESESVGECFAGKPTLILAASPGGLGGLRGLNSVRTVLTDLKALVLPDQLALSGAGGAFDDSGALVDEKTSKRLRVMVEGLVETAGRMCV